MSSRVSVFDDGNSAATAPSNGGLTTAPDWVTATVYRVDEVIYEGGLLYRCNTNHTSGGTFGGDSAYWDALGGTGDVVGPSSSTDKVIPMFTGTTGKAIVDLNESYEINNSNITEIIASQY